MSEQAATIRNGAAVIWMRKTRGGMRRVSPIACQVIQSYGDGTALVAYDRHGRRVRRMVDKKNLQTVSREEA